MLHDQRHLPPQTAANPAVSTNAPAIKSVAEKGKNQGKMVPLMK
jgi:hypothetical protein